MSGRDPRLPAPVVGPVEDDVDAVLQPVLVGGRRQQAVAEDAPPFRKEAGAGKNAAVGEEGHQATAGDEAHDMPAEGQAQCGIAFEAVEHLAIARVGFLVAPAARTDGADQAADQGERVGIRVVEGVEGSRQPLACRRAGAGQPAGDPREDRHQCIAPLTRRRRSPESTAIRRYPNLASPVFPSAAVAVPNATPPLISRAPQTRRYSLHVCGNGSRNSATRPRDRKFKRHWASIPAPATHRQPGLPAVRRIGSVRIEGMRRS